MAWMSRQVLETAKMRMRKRPRATTGWGTRLSIMKKRPRSTTATRPSPRM
jgi:hypothetical protein